jgi:hypothetical protein
VKTLPDSPSLDHLRQQAKDVLPQLRVVRPEATLSDAQTLVAEQYGFRTWPELKTEVDRRSAVVGPAHDALGASVAAAFELGVPQGPMTPVVQQWAGHAWVLTTERGRWLARQLFDWFDEGAVEAEALLAQSAAAAGILTLAPVRSPSGAIVVGLDGARWRVYTFPTVGPEPPTPADPRHAAAAGRIVGKVHALGLPAPGRVVPWLTCVRSEAQWNALHEAAASDGRPWAGRLADVIPQLLDVSGIVESADRAGETVLSACHYAPNAFCVAGDDLAVMSWEHAGAIPPRWDFGATVASWSEGVVGSVNEPAVKAALAGYAAEYDVPDPLDLGIFSAGLCGSLSWLSSRIRIALRDPDPGRREKADRAVPWLLKDPPSREKFEAVLAALQ